MPGPSERDVSILSDQETCATQDSIKPGIFTNSCLCSSGLQFFLFSSWYFRSARAHKITLWLWVINSKRIPKYAFKKIIQCKLFTTAFDYNSYETISLLQQPKGISIQIRMPDQVCALNLAVSETWATLNFSHAD